MTGNSARFATQRMLDDEAATAALGRELSLFCQAGDWIGLSGGLGAGKSVLARAFIHALTAQEASIEVPSPTFTLVQLYDHLRVRVAHCDFYRLSDAAEVEELGLGGCSGKPREPG